jgi:hypothetical protein
MKGLYSSLKKLLRIKDTGDGLTVVTGGKLDITKRLLEKIQLTNKSDIIVLYQNYDNLKEDFYSKFESEKNNSKIQVFNCDLTNQDDKEEFISYLENNKIKVKSIFLKNSLNNFIFF